MKGRAEHNAAAIAASRLPDLPNAGYSTRKERELSDAEMFIIRGLERDRLTMLSIVIEGSKLWRDRFVKAYRCIGATVEQADDVFRYLVLLCGPNPDEQRETLLQQQRQAAQQRWDYRQSTQRLFAKANRELGLDFQKERVKRSKYRVYG